MVLTLNNLDSPPPYLIDLYKNVLKSNEPVPIPRLNREIELKFKDGNRDKFMDMLKEALQARQWLVHHFPNNLV